MVTMIMNLLLIIITIITRRRRIVMETTSFQIQAQIARYTTAKLGRLRIKSDLMKFRFLGEGKPEWTERDLNNSQQEAMSWNQTLGTLVEASSHQHANPSPSIAHKTKESEFKT